VRHSTTNERKTSNDQGDDYALNKASEELKNFVHLKPRILFIITSLTVSIGMIAQEWFSYGDKTENTTKSNTNAAPMIEAFWTHPKNSCTN
jgi:hypothetical protein